MAVDPTKVPQLFFLGVTAAGQTKDMLAIFGSVYIKNTGADPCWINYTSAPPAAATDGDGKAQIQAGGALNLDDIAVQHVSARCAALQTAALQITAFKRPGNSGVGSV